MPTLEEGLALHRLEHPQGRRTGPSGQSWLLCAPSPQSEVAVPTRPTGQTALSAARSLQHLEPHFSEAGAGDAALRQHLRRPDLHFGGGSDLFADFRAA
eukprot:15477122-Alexandrium_andersonii.AAC.1